MASYGGTSTNQLPDPTQRELQRLDESARAALDRGDHQAAVAGWTQAIKRSKSIGDQATYLHRRSYALWQGGSTTQAIDDCTAVIKLRGVSPRDSVIAYRRRASIREDIGDLAGAVRDYTAGMTITGLSESSRLDLLLNRAIAHSKLHNQEEALADYAEILNAPETSPELRAAAHRNRAVFYSKHGEPEKAVADDMAVIEMPESDRRAKADCWNGVAWVRHEQDDFAGCAAAAKNCLMEYPDHAMGRFNLAIALLNLGQAEEAITHYAKGAANAESRGQLQHDALDDLQALAQKRPGLSGLTEALAIVEKRMQELPE